jgi:hypothetical protein
MSGKPAVTRFDRHTHPRGGRRQINVHESAHTLVERGAAVEGVDRREPGVPGPWAVPAVVFEVVEERANQRRVEIAQSGVGRSVEQMRRVPTDQGNRTVRRLTWAQRMLCWWCKDARTRLEIITHDFSLWLVEAIVEGLERDCQTRFA